MVAATNKKEMDMEKHRRWKQKPDRLHPDIKSNEFPEFTF